MVDRLECSSCSSEFDSLTSGRGNCSKCGQTVCGDCMEQGSKDGSMLVYHTCRSCSCMHLSKPKDSLEGKQHGAECKCKGCASSADFHCRLSVSISDVCACRCYSKVHTPPFDMFGGPVWKRALDWGLMNRLGWYGWKKEDEAKAAAVDHKDCKCVCKGDHELHVLSKCPCECKRECAGCSCGCATCFREADDNKVVVCDRHTATAHATDDDILEFLLQPHSGYADRDAAEAAFKAKHKVPIRVQQLTARFLALKDRGSENEEDEEDAGEDGEEEQKGKKREKKEDGTHKSCWVHSRSDLDKDDDNQTCDFCNKTNELCIQFGTDHHICPDCIDCSTEGWEKNPYTCSMIGHGGEKTCDIAGCRRNQCILIGFKVPATGDVLHACGRCTYHKTTKKTAAPTKAATSVVKKTPATKLAAEPTKAVPLATKKTPATKAAAESKKAAGGTKRVGHELKDTRALKKARHS